MDLQTYFLNEGQCQIPADWRDESLNIFRIPASAAAGEASLVISRDYGQGTGRFDDFIQQQLHQCQHTLPEFKLLQKQICSEPFSYAWVDYTWQARERCIMLRQLFFESRPANIIVSLTTTPEDAAAHEAAFRAMVRSVQLKHVVNAPQARMFG